MWNMFNSNYKAVCIEWKKCGLETLVVVVDQKKEPGTLWQSAQTVIWKEGEGWWRIWTGSREAAMTKAYWKVTEQISQAVLKRRTGVKVGKTWHDLMSSCLSGVWQGAVVWGGCCDHDKWRIVVAMKRRTSESGRRGTPVYRTLSTFKTWA